MLQHALSTFDTEDSDMGMVIFVDVIFCGALCANCLEELSAPL